MLALFVGLSVLTVFGTAIILLSKSVVHAAYALALVLLGVSGVYVLLNAELLAVVQILLYAGGVVILLAFGIMMTNRMKEGQVRSGTKNQALALIISLSLFGLFAYLIATSDFDTPVEYGEINQVEKIGISFLTDHIVAFELIAFVLLVALLGAAYLAKMSTDD